MLYRALLMASLDAFVLTSPAAACPETAAMGDWLDELIQRNLFGLPVHQAPRAAAESGLERHLQLLATLAQSAP